MTGCNSLSKRLLYVDLPVDKKSCIDSQRGGVGQGGMEGMEGGGGLTDNVSSVLPEAQR